MLLQHPLLQISSSARGESLGTLYRQAVFVCEFDLDAGESDELIIATAPYEPWP